MRRGQGKEGREDGTNEDLLHADGGAVALKEEKGKGRGIKWAWEDGKKAKGGKRGKEREGKREARPTIDLKMPSVSLYRLSGVSISRSSPKSMTATRKGRWSGGVGKEKE